MKALSGFIGGKADELLEGKTKKADIDPVYAASASLSAATKGDNSIPIEFVLEASEIAGAVWIKAAGLRSGMEIAVHNSPQPSLTLRESEGELLFERIVSIERLAPEQVYDIEVEGTHNFVGNDILAHNTFLATNSGNVGIGAAVANSKLEVLGTASTSLLTVGGSGLTSTTTTIYGGINIDANTLVVNANEDEVYFQNGNVGIGTTNPTTTLSIVGTSRFNGTVEVGGTISSQGAGSLSERFGAFSLASGASSSAFGNSASASQTQSSAFGYAAAASGQSTAALGSYSVASANYAIAIGNQSTASGLYSIGIGEEVSVTHQGSIVLGTVGASTATNQFVVGSAFNTISNVYFGQGVTNSSPAAVTINSTGGSGSNIAGANLILAGGKGTGTGVGGDIVFQVAAAGSSGTSQNSLTELARFKNDGGLRATTTGDTILRLSNSTGTNDIFKLFDNTTQVFNVADGGIASGTTLRLQEGAAGTPAFSFSNDTNTGLFQNGADTIALAAGGTTELSITTATTTVSDSLVVDTNTLIVNGNDNKVSIGLANPWNSALHIEKTFTTDEHTYGLVLRPTYNFTAGGTREIRGQYIFNTYNVTKGANTVNVYGIDVESRIPSGYNATTNYGGSFLASQYSSGTSTTMYGTRSEANVSSSGTGGSVYGAYNLASLSTSAHGDDLYGTFGYVLQSSGDTDTASASGLYGFVENTSGTITNAYGVYSIVRNNNASSIMTNAYGLYIDNSSTSGTITNRYDIYASSSNAKSYFAGNIGIATTTPDALLSIENTGTGKTLYITDQASDITPFIIDASGNVGIGVVSTSQKLEVLGTASTSLLTVGGSGLTSTTTTVYGGATFDTNTLVVNANDNKVGIGTVTGQNTFEVAGSVGIYYSKSNDAYTPTDYDTYSQMYITNTNSTANGSTGISFFADTGTGGGGMGAIGVTRVGSGIGDMFFVTRGSGFAQNERMRLTGTGRLGIGTAGPVAMLNASSTAATTVAGAFSAYASQTANILNITSSTNTFYSGFTASGGLLMNIASTTALNIQNGSGLPGFVVDTTNASSTIAGTFRVDRRSGGNETLFRVGTSTADILTISSNGDTSLQNGTTTIDQLVTGAMQFDADAGTLSWIDMPVTSAASASTIESYTAAIDGNSMLTVYAESDGSGGIQNARIGLFNSAPTAAFTIGDTGSGDTYNFLTVPNTGAYATSTLNTGLTVATTTLVVNASEQRVGIGTTVPSSLLTVSTSGATATTTTIYGGATFDTNTLIVNANENRVGIGTATPTSTLQVNGSANITGVLNVNNATLYTTNAGNVGIGTTAPLGQLQLNQRMVLQGVVNNQLLLGYNVYYDGTNWKYIASDEAAAIRMGDATGGPSNGAITFRTLPSGTAGATITTMDSAAIKMTINNAGNLGIGTASPAAQLHITSDARIPTLNASTTVIDLISGSRIRATSTSDEVLRLSNSTGTNDIFKLFDNTTQVFNVADGGIASGTTLRLQEGAVGTPAFSFSNDTDSGIYSPAADQLAVTLAGERRLLIGGSSGSQHTFYSNTDGGASLRMQNTWGGGNVISSVIALNDSSDSVGISAYGSNYQGNSGSGLAGQGVLAAANDLYIVAGTGEISSSTSTIKFVTGVGSANLPNSVKMIITSDGSISATSTSDVALRVSNGSGTNAIFRLLDNTNPVFNVADGGIASGTTLRLQEGSVSAPAFSFSNDTDTGIYSAAANTLNIGTGGTHRLTVNSSGNLGIATTTPSGILDVNGAVKIGAPYAGNADLTAPTNGLLVAGNVGIGARTGVNNKLEIGATTDTSANAVQINTDVNNEQSIVFAPATNYYFTIGNFSNTGRYFQIRNNAGTPQLVIGPNNTGNVGIGIGSAAPNAKLEVLGTASTSLLTVGGTGLTSTTTTIYGGATFDSTTLVVNANENRVGIGTAAPTSTLQTNGSVNLTWGSGNTSAVYVQSSDGNVGIGTVEPAGPLDILRNGSDTTFPMTNPVSQAFQSGGALRVRNINGSTNSHASLILDPQPNGWGAVIAGRAQGANDTALDFYTANSASLGLRMVINAAGNVGIGLGTINPTSKLEVLGTASTSLLTVGGTGLTSTTTTIYGGMTVDATTLVVNANENRVGIGTATPTSTLQVNGSVHLTYGSGNASGLYMSSSTGAVGLNNTSPTTTLHIIQEPGAALTSPTALKIVGGAHPRLNTSIEAVDVNFALDRTVLIDDAPYAYQRAVVIQSPTYGRYTGVNAAITDAASLFIGGPPKNSNIGSGQFGNTYGLLIGTANTNAGAVISRATGLGVFAPTGASINFAAQFFGNASTSILTVGGSGLNSTTTTAYGGAIFDANDNTLVVNGSENRVGIGTVNPTSTLHLIQAAGAAGESPTAFKLGGGAHNRLANGVEAIDVNFDLARSVVLGDAAYTLQRAMVIQAPTYERTGANTALTNAVTLDISGPPRNSTIGSFGSTYGVRINSTNVKLDVNNPVSYASALTTFAPTGAGNNYAAEFYGTASTSLLTVGGTGLTSTTTTVYGGATFDSTTLVVNANENRVGIGTASPGAKLDVTLASGDTGVKGLNVDFATAGTLATVPLVDVYGATTGAAPVMRVRQKDQSGDVGTALLVEGSRSSGAYPGLWVYAQGVATSPVGPLAYFDRTAATIQTDRSLGDTVQIMVPNDSGSAGLRIQAKNQAGYTGPLLALDQLLAGTAQKLVTMTMTATTAIGIDINAAVSATGNLIQATSSGGSAGDLFNVTGAGRVGIATTTPYLTLTVHSTAGQRDAGVFNGAICADNNGLTKCYAALTAGTVYGDASSFGASDVAENYPVAGQAGPGDVMVVSRATGSDRDRDISELEGRANKQDSTPLIETLSGAAVSLSQQAYASDIIGVVSTKPGVLLGDITGFNLHSNFQPIALSGRVPVKVTSENGPIKAGDLLVAAPTPGHAMRYDPADPSPLIPLPQGARGRVGVIGVALEDFDKESGTVMTFINLEHEEITVAAKDDLSELIVVEGCGNLKVSTTCSGGLQTSNAKALMFNADALFAYKLAAQNGQWQLDEEGKLVIRELEVEKVKIAGDKTVGFGRIGAGEVAVDIKNGNVTDNALIFITFVGDLEGRSYFISSKQPGEGFTVKLSANLASDVDFQYWIVDSDLDYEAFRQSQEGTVAGQQTEVPTLEPAPEQTAESATSTPEIIPTLSDSATTTATTTGE